MVRGIDAAILRTAMGSSVQLPTYNWTKNQLVSRGILPNDSVLTYLASSSVSGICVVSVTYRLSNYEKLILFRQLLMMQPADTVCSFFILTLRRRSSQFILGFDPSIQSTYPKAPEWSYCWHAV